jgi:glycosyltransferase involved in cell wall biosynthesis
MGDRDDSNGAIRVARIGRSTTLNRVLRYQMRHLATEGFEIVCYCEEDEWTDDLRRSGLPIVELGLGHRPGPLTAARWGFRVYRELRRSPVDIVHTHNAFHGIAGRIAARLAGTPVIVQTVHNWWYLDPPRAPRSIAYRALERLGGLLSDAVYFINRDDLHRATRERIIAAGRCQFIGNGIDVDDFRARLASADGTAIRHELGVELGIPLVVMVARFEPPKDHATFLEAFDAVRRRVPDAHALLIGYGPDRAAVEASARARGMSGSVRCLSHRDDIPAILSACNLLVLASQREGFGRALVEGMVAGLPVIGSDVAGIRDVIDHGRTGLLVAPGQPGALADAMTRVLSDDSYARRLAEAGRAHAVEAFDESVPAARLAASYRELVHVSGS